MVKFFAVITLILILPTKSFAHHGRNEREPGVVEKIVTISIWTTVAIVSVLGILAVAHSSSPTTNRIRNPSLCAHHVEPKTDEEFLKHDCPCMPY